MRPKAPCPRLRLASPSIARREHDILKRAVLALSDQVAAASALVDEAMAAGLDGSHPVTVHAKMLRLELIKTKSAIRWEQFVLDCSSCHPSG